MNKIEFQRRVEESTPQRVKHIFDNAGWAYGLSNCSRCKKMTNDYAVFSIIDLICKDCLTLNEFTSLCMAFRSGSQFTLPLAIDMVVEWLESEEAKTAHHCSKTMREIFGQTPSVMADWIRNKYESEFKG